MIKFVRLKRSMLLRVIHMSVHAFGVHKLERWPTQSGCDYARRFTSSFSGTLMSLLLSLLKLRTCLRHANETYSFMYVYMSASYFLHESASHAFLYLSPAAPLVSVPFHAFARVCTHVHTKVRRVDYRLRFRVDYTFTVHALVSADFASRAVSTWFPRRNQKRSRNVCVRRVNAFRR